MASASPSDRVDSEFTCCICLDTFDCPCTLSCGHSFCLKCLNGTWETASSFSCPQCRATFPERPRLTRNVTLANLVEQRRAAEKMAGVVFCDACDDGKTSAVKTCLQCEMSLCESHLKPHLKNPKLKEHLLMAPTVNLEERRCQQHREPYKFYCKQDGSLVCRDCTIAGDHIGHKVIMLETEQETRKNQVGQETRAVEWKRKEAEASVGRMEAARKDVQESMDETKAHISSEFTRMRRKLDEDERKALGRVDVKGREVLSRIDKNIAHHKREISELQAAAARLRALEQERDPLTFLQGHMKKIERTHHSPPHALPSDLAVGDMSCCSGIIKKLKFSTLYGRSPTLDTNTAHDNLKISSDLRTVTRTGVSQGRPDHPPRFDACYQALCSQSFSSGSHYWEVDVGGTELCRVGVAYGTIARKGRGIECRLGMNDSSWVLWKYNNSWSVRHGGVETTLALRDPPRRVGCHVHWEVGLLAFYDADSMELLHAFNDTFTQPLYPALSVWVTGESVRILDLSRE